MTTRTTSAAATPTAVNPVQKGYVGDLLNLMGARWTLYSPSRPDEERVEFASPELARLADNVLRDTVLGVKLVLTTDPDQPAAPPNADPRKGAWFDGVSAIASAVAALPGVLDYRIAGMHDEHVYFWTSSAERAEHLKPLVNDSFGGTTVHWIAPKTPGAVRHSQR